MEDKNYGRYHFTTGKVINLYSEGVLLNTFKTVKGASKHLKVPIYDIEHSYSRKTYKIKSPLYPGKVVARLRDLLPEMEFDKNDKLII